MLLEGKTAIVTGASGGNGTYINDSSISLLHHATARKTNHLETTL